MLLILLDLQGVEFLGECKPLLPLALAALLSNRLYPAWVVMG